MSAQAVGLAASALLVANEVSSGDASTLWGVATGNAEPNAHKALIRLGLMGAGVVVLVVGASQGSPWPSLVAIILVALWVLWALHTFAGVGKSANPGGSSSAQAPGGPSGSYTIPPQRQSGYGA